MLQLNTKWRTDWLKSLKATSQISGSNSLRFLIWCYFKGNAVFPSELNALEDRKHRFVKSLPQLTRNFGKAFSELLYHLDIVRIIARGSRERQ
jgi:hypothetical protein